MIHQYYAQRFRASRPSVPTGKPGKAQVFFIDSGDKRIGTIPVGTIVYIQDGVSPLCGLTRDVICREPWVVEAWIPQDYSKWNAARRVFERARISGGHLAQVRSLRNRRRVQLVADWILLACIDAGLEKVF